MNYGTTTTRALTRAYSHAHTHAHAPLHVRARTHTHTIMLNFSSLFLWIPACPSLVCFFNRGDIEGTDSSKKFMFDVCVCFMQIYVGTDFVVLGEFVV